MELTIAIWKDCKRLLTDNQPITCRRLQPFADIKVHVERLAATAWPDTEEIGVVRELYGSFLSRDVYGHRQSLPVGIIGGQRGVLRMLQVLLVKEAQGGIAQRQEQIVVRIERVGTTRETGHP